ncbi:MAG TPA: c-type cytochrome [Mucilaginibacter sp.]|jgi:mono/diheme cytochrome c family protein|nr:c-type cytochrome [Mucilaginibacter sp.]
MKKFIKWVAWILVVVIVIVGGLITYVVTALPNVGAAENINVDKSPEHVARGKYLVQHVVPCTDCHSPRVWDRFAGPIDTTRLGAGGEVFDSSVGFPGKVTVPDITPAKLKDWTDGELLRTFTTGVKKDGSPIFPMMPWPYFSKMDRQDAYDIVAYIRTLKPIDANYPKAELDFPLNILVHTMPKKADFGARPDPKDTVKYGAYLVQIAACKFCHTQDNKGELIPGMDFAGGKPFGMPNNRTIRTANITPDKITGIGSWSKADFLARFAAFKDPSKAPKVSTTDFQTIMPWYVYAGMTDQDLGAIYAYLRTVKPVKNTVVKFTLNKRPQIAGN